MYMSRVRALLFLLCEVVIFPTTQTKLLLIRKFPPLNLYTAQPFTNKLVKAVLCVLSPSRLPASFRNLPKIAYIPTFQQNLAAASTSLPQGLLMHAICPSNYRECQAQASSAFSSAEAKWHSELLSSSKLLTRLRTGSCCTPTPVPSRKCFQTCGK